MFKITKEKNKKTGEFTGELWVEIPVEAMAASTQKKIKALHDHWEKGAALKDDVVGDLTGSLVASADVLPADVVEALHLAGGKVPAGKEMIVGFNFGRISVATKPVVASSGKATAPTVKLKTA